MSGTRILGRTFLQRLFDRGLRRLALREGAVAVTRRLAHYAVLAVGLGVALDTLGLSLATLFAAGAIFAIDVGRFAAVHEMGIRAAIAEGEKP
jgi:hypothetical protein